MAETTGNGTKNETHNDLERKIVRQIEFYFGDFNLMRDTFMQEKMKEDDGWFTMDIMLKFKRLSSLCNEPGTILQALKTSKSGLLEIDVENMKIRRRTNRQVPLDGEAYRSQLKARTVYVSGFQNEESIDAINDFLSEYGGIEGIQLQRTKDKKFKGSLFATFFKQDDAERFIHAPMVYYKCNELKKMSRTEFYKNLDAEKRERKRTTEESQKQEDLAKNEYLKGIVVMKVSGISDDAIYHTDIKEVFKSIDIGTIRFFDRTKKDCSMGYLIFQEERTVDELLQILEDKTGGKTVKIKSADVEFSAPNEVEKEQIQHEYLNARERIFNARGKKSKQTHHSKKGKMKTPSKNSGKRRIFDSDEAECEKDAVDGSSMPSPKHAKIEKKD